MKNHKNFLKFHDEIIPTTSKLDILKNSSNKIRETLKKYFIENKISAPKFFHQGSYSLKTLILPKDGEIDLDDGVYIQGYCNFEDLPKPKIIHEWIYKALENRTNELPERKNTCIRIKYAGNYHIDLPIYYEYQNEFYIGKRKDDEWIKSDSKKFKEWFLSLKTGEELQQMKRIIKYLKFLKNKSNLKISGIALTILVGKHFISYKNDDERSFKETLEKITRYLNSCNFLFNPVDSTEDMMNRYTENQKLEIKEKINKWKDLAVEAYNILDEVDASKKWNKLFGEKFKIKDYTNETIKATTLSTSNFKAWGN